VDVSNLIAELKRRRVFRVLIGYGVVAFAVLQVVEPIEHALGLSDAALKFVVVLLGLGFPIAVVLAWAFDVNAGRIERTAPAAEGLKGTRLALVLVGIGALAAAPGLAWYLLRANASGQVAAAKHAVPSIAVLPFSDLSEKHDQEYFADGVAEEILNALAQVQGLKVIGRTSSFSFKGKGEDLKSIGQKLEVAHILEGSLRKDGDQLRITTQLIRVADGSDIWSQTYDRKLAGIFKLQEEIARTVVGALRLKLLGGAEISPGLRTTSSQVYDLFLLGREQARIPRPSSGDRAIEAFEKAVAIDPGFAPAWAQLALAHFKLVDSFGAAPEGLRAKAMAEAERAVALAPELAQAHAARARLRYFLQLDVAGALADIDRALAVSPNDPDSLAIKAQFIFPNGGPALSEGLSLLRRATELDPLNAEAWTQRGQVLVWSGDYAAAAQALAQVESIAPGSTSAVYVDVMLHILEGRPAVALEKARATEVAWVRLTGVALAEHDLGHERESKAALDELISIDNPEATAAYQIAQVHARRGAREAALDWLERAYKLRDTGVSNLKADPFLAGLHGEPRFKALIRKMNLPPD
jgi:serine/threonine-protein kinase